MKRRFLVSYFGECAPNFDRSAGGYVVEGRYDGDVRGSGKWFGSAADVKEFFSSVEAVDDRRSHSESNGSWRAKEAPAEKVEVTFAYAA